MRLKLRSVLLIAPLVTLVGCSQGVMIGDVPSNPAPQIVFLGAKDKVGDDYLTWRDVPSFGQVPAELKAKGDISCMQYDLILRAVGYHPDALDRKGNKIPGGGFFCSPFAGLLEQSSTPQLTDIDGQLTWKNPGAFTSDVPEELMAEGEQVCNTVSETAYPLAYSKKALNADGTAIDGGAFLCVEPIEKF